MSRRVRRWVEMASDMDAAIDTGEGGNGLAGGDESLGSPPLPSQRAAILRSGVIVIVLLFTFGIILPRFVDYNEVKEGFLALTIQQIALMTVLGATAWFVAGQTVLVLTP